MVRLCVIIKYTKKIHGFLAWPLFEQAKQTKLLNLTILLLHLCVSFSAVRQKGGRHQNNAPMGISCRLDGNERHSASGMIPEQNILNCNRHWTKGQRRKNTRRENATLQRMHPRPVEHNVNQFVPVDGILIRFILLAAIIRTACSNHQDTPKHRNGTRQNGTGTHTQHEPKRPN